MGDKGDYFVDEVYDRPDKVVIGTSGREVVKQDPTERVIVGQECPPADPLTFENIMGQEDFFRQESGVRVDNRGTARIVITTPGNAEVKRIEYDVNPVDEDNPVFNETWTIGTTGGTHEVFRPIVPDALYAFQVIITQPGEGEKTSGIYYFNTSTEVDVDPVTLDVEVFVSIETVDKSTSVEVSQLDGLAPQTVKDGGTSSVEEEDFLAWRYQPSGVTPSLVLYNPLDGDADSLIGPDGTINGDPQPAAGVLGTPGEALDFDPTDGTIDYVTFGEVLNPGGALTVSAWVNADALTSGSDYNRMLTKFDGSTSAPGHFLFDVTDSNVLRFILKNSSGDFESVTGSTTISTGTWYHVAVVYDAGAVTLYVNGVEDGTSTFTETTIPDSTQTWAVAADVPTGNFDEAWRGKIDEPHIYDRALAPIEVKELFRNPVSPRFAWRGFGGSQMLEMSMFTTLVSTSVS